MPDKPISITLAGDLTKPAVTLIEKISDAVGGALRPFQIVRVANAEAKATLIHGKAEIEVENLQRRAMRRFAAEEAKKQANMEQIIRDAIPLLEDKSAPENVPDDWIVNFFEKCRIISDEDMQRLWSRILGGEANSPGSYARKTVNLLSDLDKTDALLFTRLCGFVWRFVNTDPPSSMPLIFKFLTREAPFADVYSGQGINLSTASHLETLGLIRSGGAFFPADLLPYRVQMKYFGRTAHLVIQKLPVASDLPFGDISFTRAGAELANACGSSPVEGFFEFVCAAWERASYLVSVAKPAPEFPTPPSPPKP